MAANCDFNNSFMSLNPSEGALNNQSLGAGDLSCGKQFGGSRRGRRKTRRTNRKRRSLRKRRSVRKIELSEDELEVMKPKRRSKRRSSKRRSSRTRRRSSRTRRRSSRTRRSSKRRSSKRRKMSGGVTHPNPRYRIRPHSYCNNIQNETACLTDTGPCIWSDNICIPPLSGRRVPAAAAPSV